MHSVEPTPKILFSHATILSKDCCCYIQLICWMKCGAAATEPSSRSDFLHIFNSLKAPGACLQLRFLIIRVGRYDCCTYPSKAGASATAAAALVGATAAFSGVGTASPPSSGGVAACTEKTSTLAETVAGRASAAASVVAAGTKSSSDAAGKPGSTYADRVFRVIGLMDPRHTLTTEADVRRYQRLLKEHRVGEVSRDKSADNAPMWSFA